MAINRAQLAKELEPGLNALFGMEYARYEAEHTEIYETESSDRYIWWTNKHFFNILNLKKMVEYFWVVSSCIILVWEKLFEKIL